MNRCFVSVPSNMAGETVKSSNKYFYIFLGNAQDSLFEWQTQLIIAHKIEYISTEYFEKHEMNITLM